MVFPSSLAVEFEPSVFLEGILVEYSTVPYSIRKKCQCSDRCPWAFRGDVAKKILYSKL